LHGDLTNVYLGVKNEEEKCNKDALPCLGSNDGSSRTVKKAGHAAVLLGRLVGTLRYGDY